MYDGAAPCGGVIAGGLGVVEGAAVMGDLQRRHLKGWHLLPITVKKHLAHRRSRTSAGCPCIYLVDSGGANLPNQDEVFPDRDHFGRIFYNQAQMSAQGIAHIAGGHGLVHGQGAPMCRRCRT